MSKFIMLSLFAALLYASPEARTQFVFEREQSTNFSGKCYEVDSKSKGRKFKTKVDIKNCKPAQTQYLFLPIYGRCYLVDSETNGLAYIESLSDTRRCKTPNISIGIKEINGRSSCYEYDKESKGLKYFKKLSSEDCLETSNVFVWISKTKFRGECYQKAPQNQGGALNKVKDRFCRPEKVTYTFSKNNSDFFKGKCYEVHPESSLNYSKSVEIDLCKPKETAYIFYTPEGKKTGKCFELDTLTRGEKYIDTVLDSLCKESL